MENCFQKLRNFYDNYPTRISVGVMLFMAGFLNYMLRVNLSINILAMVESTTGNDTILPDYGKRYEWSLRDQSLLLGAYFWGFVASSIPGGVLADKFGGRQVIGLSMILSIIFNTFIPAIADWGIGWVICMRFLIGLMGGPTFPGIQTLISKWAPPDEKGKFVATIMGGTFGTVITWPLLGLIIEYMGWIYAFYIPSVITAILTALWYYFVYDSPETHPRINKQEREYIVQSLGDNVSKQQSFPPLVSVFTSPPFWALLLLHYGSVWGLNFLIVATPKFMNTVLNFQITTAGFLSALPHLARLFCGFLFGEIADIIMRKHLMSVTAIRKSFTFFSHILPGIFLIVLTYSNCSPYVCVALITFSLGLNGASTVTNLQNSHDLAPNYAGTLYGIINFCGTTAGFITPMVLAHFTKDENTMTQWNYVFIIGGVVYAAPVITFLLFGSGEVQSWNQPKKAEETQETKETPGVK